MAKAVVCVFSDAPIRPGVSTQTAFGMPLALMGKLGSEAPTGLFGPVASYAMAARRYMHRFNVTEDHLGAVAVACRQWALKSPLAMMKKPLTMEEHHNSPYVVEPFHLFDCSFPVNGAVAVVVTGTEAAADGPQPAVYVHGMGQGHRGVTNRRGFENEIEIGAKLAGEKAFAMAGVEPKDITTAQMYDAFTYCIMLQLEQYGFVPPGGAGEFVSSGQTAPGGSFPVNTGGGQLSGYYLQGATPLSEGVMQARGTAGERQVRNDLVLTAAYGGRMMYHACMITSPHRSL
jgi:acetyl-CoA acetyltransferase